MRPSQACDPASGLFQQHLIIHCSISLHGRYSERPSRWTHRVCEQIGEHALAIVEREGKPNRNLHESEVRNPASTNAFSVLRAVRSDASSTDLAWPRLRLPQRSTADASLGARLSSTTSSFKAIQIEELRRKGELVEHHFEGPTAEFAQGGSRQVAEPVPISHAKTVGSIHHAREFAAVPETVGQIILSSTFLLDRAGCGQCRRQQQPDRHLPDAGGRPLDPAGRRAAADPRPSGRPGRRADADSGMSVCPIVSPAMFQHVRTYLRKMIGGTGTVAPEQVWPREEGP